MELAIFTLLFLSNVGYCQSFDAQNISKIICSLSTSSHVDIFKQELVDSIKLSKDLFQECNIRVRIVFDVSDNVKRDFILFASQQQDKKAQLTNFCKLISRYLNHYYLTCMKQEQSGFNSKIKRICKRTWGRLTEKSLRIQSMPSSEQQLNISKTMPKSMRKYKTINK